MTRKEKAAAERSLTRLLDAVKKWRTSFEWGGGLIHEEDRDLIEAFDDYQLAKGGKRQ